MAVEDQRLALGLRRTVRADHVPGVVIGDRDRREAGQMPDVVHLDLPAVDDQPALAIGARHEVLRRRLLPAEGRQGDQRRGELHLLVEAPVDGVEDLGGDCGVDHRSIPLSAGYHRSRRRAPSFDGLRMRPSW